MDSQARRYAPVIESARLRLRPQEMADFDTYAGFFASPRSRFVDGPVDRREAWRNFVTDCGQWSLLGFGSWAVEVIDGGFLAGQVGLNRPPHFPENEMGWVVFEGFEGQGIAQEAALMARRFAFDQLGWTTVVSYIDPENTRSIALAERLGAQRDNRAERPAGDNCLVYRHLRS